MIRRKIFLFSVNLILVLLGLSTTPGVARACSCIQWTEAEQFDAAAAVFSGVARNVTDSGWGRSIDFEVDEVSKGDVGDAVTVTTGMGHGDCGYDFQEGTPYKVYAHGVVGGLETSICSGTHMLPPNGTIRRSTIPIAGATGAAFLGVSVAIWLMSKKRNTR